MIILRFSLDVAGLLKYEDDPGPAAVTLCLLVDSPSLITLGLDGGIASVVIITLDRYWKIVHSVHYRKYYRRWMLYVGLLLPWLNGIAVHLLPSIGTTRIVNGRCVPTAFWPSESMSTVCLKQCSSVCTKIHSGPERIAQSLMHRRHIATVCSRITQFSPKCSEKITLYQSM